MHIEWQHRTSLIGDYNGLKPDLFRLFWLHVHYFNNAIYGMPNQIRLQYGFNGFCLIISLPTVHIVINQYGLCTVVIISVLVSEFLVAIKVMQ